MGWLTLGWQPGPVQTNTGSKSAHLGPLPPSSNRYIASKLPTAMAKTNSSSSFGSPTGRDWLMPVALVLEAALAIALAGGLSAPPLAAALVAVALGVGLWGSLGRTGMPAATATALSLIALVADR